MPTAAVAARKTLKASALFWFVVAVIGQILFATAIALTYAPAVLRGDFGRWNKGAPHAYVAGEPFANAMFAVHILSAFLIILSGVLQLIPAIRSRAPRFHRWNGRLYLLVGFGVSLAGIYMMLGRGTVGTTWQHVGTILLALLIMFLAVMAWRTAVARDFAAHRRWALRLYITVSASLFIRAATFLAAALPGGPYGFDPVTFSGPWLTFISFGQYLVPLAVLELYLRAQTRGSSAFRFATATGIFALTVGLGAGIAATTAGAWGPRVRAALDPRTSIADTLSATIANQGIDDALQQYTALKAGPSAATYNFDESELNDLGYRLLRQKHFVQAIRILELNTQVYPHSFNVYDSLGEAYADAGDKLRAIAFYRQSLQLNPKNGGAVLMLRKLAAQ